MKTIVNLAGMDALRGHGFGDSIFQGGTAGGQSPGPWGVLDAPGGLYDSINALMAAKTGPAAGVRLATGVGYPASSAPGSHAATSPLIPFRPPNLTKYGRGGSGITYLTNASGTAINEAHYAEFVTSFVTPPKCDFLIMGHAINDVLTSDQATHFAAGTTVLNRLHADYPTTPIFWWGCLFINETWSSSGGNHYTGPPNPFGLGNFVDQNISALCALRPSYTEYCSQVDHALAYDVAFGPPEPGPPGGIGLLSLNGLHPTLLGQQQQGVWGLAHMNLVTS